MRTVRTLLILPILSIFFFVGCPDSKDDGLSTNELLLSLFYSSRFNCADVKANSDTAQTIPFRTINSTNSSSTIYFNVTAGQKVSISSLTTDLSTKSVSVDTACSGSSVTSSTIFSRANTTTNITLTALKSYEGLLSITFSTKPTDLTVQILP